MAVEKLVIEQFEEGYPTIAQGYKQIMKEQYLLFSVREVIILHQKKNILMN